MIERVRFFVAGKPQTAGSKTAIPTPAGPRVIEAGSKVSRARKRTWRGDLRDAAVDAHGAALLDGPLALTIVIVRRRPSTHMGTGRNAGVVKDWARAAQPIERPDTVKLVRAAEDALTGVLWIDDSQIVHHSLFKAFGDQVGLPPLAEGMFVAVAAESGYMGPQVSFALEAAA